MNQLPSSIFETVGEHSTAIKAGEKQLDTQAQDIREIRSDISKIKFYGIAILSANMGLTGVSMVPGAVETAIGLLKDGRIAVAVTIIKTFYYHFYI